jgi:lysozyme family protein
MADYKHAIAKVLPFEGYILNKKVGYVNDKDDSGGETIGGIAFNFWPEWGGWPIIHSAKKLHGFPGNLVGNMQLYGLLLDFYKKNFWDKIGGDFIASQTIGNNLVDSAVNEGIKPAIKRAQSIVLLAQTGIVTPELVTKLNLLV